MSHLRANPKVVPFVGTTSSYFAPFGHDFGRPGVHSQPLAPRVVHDVLRSPGQPLDPEARAFFEPRYGHDFSRVRVHADQRAGESARAIGAAAYAVGWEIAFAEGRYQPRTADGRRLLAHELAHVAEQKGAAELDPNLEIGHPSDVAERSADAAAERALQGRRQTSLRASEATATLRRTPIDSWAGTFDGDDPKPIVNIGTEDGVVKGAYGAKTEIRFSPKGVAHADEVALVQTAASLWDGQPYYIGSESERKSTAARSTAAGTHIDQPDPSARTPLAGMKDPPATSNDLAVSRPGPNVQFGNPATKKGEPIEIIEGTNPNQAVLVDQPTIGDVPDEVAVSQTLQTAALAVSGPRRGVYYGAVTWGWHKEAGERKVILEPLKAATSPQAGPKYNDAPTQEFGAASDLWNKTITDKNNRLPLPIASGKFVAHTGTPLMDIAAGSKRVASLDLHTRVEITGQTDQKHPDWVSVIVTDGSQVGKQGWAETRFLSDLKVKRSQ